MLARGREISSRKGNLTEHRQRESLQTTIAQLLAFHQQLRRELLRLLQLALLQGHGGDREADSLERDPRDPPEQSARLLQAGSGRGQIAQLIKDVRELVERRDLEHRIVDLARERQ